MNQITTGPQGGMPSIIERAALDPDFDLDKLQRLLEMQEASEVREGEKAFTAAHAAAEAEMEAINADARNDQTKSRYATFAQVDRAVRPIYTQHGFAISFTTEPMGTPDSLLVVGTLSHRQGGSRRYQVPVPIVTKGIAGREMMTSIHATMSAVSYGKRNLEVMMFNLQVDRDTDGNTPRSAPTSNQEPRVSRPPTQYTHPETGEVIDLAGEDLTPGMIEWLEQDTWQTWVQRVLAHLRTSRDAPTAQQWLDLNAPTMLRMKEEKPATYEGVMSAVGAYKKTLG